MAREKAEKLWIAGGAAASLVVAGAVWMFAVKPELSGADSIRGQAADTQVQNAAMQANVTRLQKQYAGIDKLRAVLAAAHQALPSDLALSTFTKQISAQASASHVSVDTLTAGSPTAYLSAASAAPTGTDSAASTPAPASSTSTAGAPSAAPGVYNVPITVVVSGTQADDLAFLRKVQHDGPRAALLSNATLNGPVTGKSAGTSLSVQMQVFVVPAAVASTGTAAPTASPTPGS